ncbi:MAG: tRNA uridine-5-carboxymethylaminomethyl(34) synthesis GTPase MnmE, partial [Clostridia bacterium]|nr:tRNA uridine-5-carboxymethylaminomethyl(34) synthesis GTPase MnmE [Clostridia bacterium]
AKCDLIRREHCDLLLSSLTGEGLNELKALMYERGYGRESDVFVLEERHYRAAKAAYEAAELALSAAESGLPPELYAEEVHRAWYELGSFSGETASEAVISEIFEKFCVGK